MDDPFGFTGLTYDDVLLLPGNTDVIPSEASTSTRLSRIFGPHALNDLYLKGRVVIKADPQQVSMLA